MPLLVGLTYYALGSVLAWLVNNFSGPLVARIVSAFGTAVDSVGLGWAGKARGFTQA